MGRRELRRLCWLRTDGRAADSSPVPALSLAARKPAPHSEAFQGCHGYDTTTPIDEFVSGDTHSTPMYRKKNTSRILHKQKYYQKAQILFRRLVTRKLKKSSSLHRNGHKNAAAHNQNNRGQKAITLYPFHFIYLNIINSYHDVKC